MRLIKGALILTLAFALIEGAFAADQREEHGGSPPAARAAPARGEPHAGPRGYTRVTPPRGWNTRPATVNRSTYQHNYQAAKSFKIGPYSRPTGWVARRWTYGEVLPPAYWAGEYLVADYWLFALEVPPAGYEWVRDDTDAILVNTSTGQILQVEYGVFA